MVRKIVVVSYDPNWVKKFQMEANNIKSILKDEIIAVHHIGSTAIPQISAKPIIDILVEVYDINKIDDYNSKMSEQSYIPKGEFGIPKRRFFIKGTEESRTYHVHIHEKENPDIKRHLNFRDYMIAHPKEAQAYSRLKEDLARKYPEDIDGYCDGKVQFIKNIDEKAKDCI